jgi:integrase
LARREVSPVPPKYGSERVVSLPQQLIELLARHIEIVGVRGEERWLFVGNAGLPPHQNTVHYWWTKTVARLGVGATRLHDMRHFYASGLIAAGCDVVTVQRALGHAKATTTLATYSHLWPTAENRTRSEAGDLMKTSLAIPADYLRTETAETVRNPRNPEEPKR